MSINISLSLQQSKAQKQEEAAAALQTYNYKIFTKGTSKERNAHVSSRFMIAEVKLL
jgi:hypothetical protein